jgi:uncharacterized phage protein gp47/JayE
MAIELSSLSELDQTLVDQMFATFTQYMQERHPEVELTRGVFHDLVLYFNSALSAAVRQNIDRVRQSNSLLAISQNPALADSTIVDQVLSNYGLTRDDGSRAVGEVTVVLQSPTQTAIQAGVQFSVDGVLFRPTQDFMALPPGSLITNSDEREMLAVGDGTYAVNVLMQATDVGAVGNVRRGVKFVPDSVPNNMVDAFAAIDFVGGADPASNTDYIAKLAPALAAKTVGGRASYAAALRNVAAFSAIPHFSILGCGDAEQQRDQHGLFPMSGGGKIDIYCQTHSAAQERDHLLEAVYVGPSATGTIWQVTLDRDTAPGFYEIVRIAKPLTSNSEGYAVLQDIRGVDLSDLAFIPDIRDHVEGAYTRYQTAVIQFEDTDTVPTGLVAASSRARYSVTTAGLPLIAAVQDFLSDRENRSAAADVLVKAAVPCFTKISFEIRREATAADTTDEAAIKAALVTEIQKIGFSGQLHASVISGVVHRFLTGRQAVSAIDMFGRIRRPDGATQYVRDNARLQIPDDPGRLVTGRTTAFLVGPQDISISFVAAGFVN